MRSTIALSVAAAAVAVSALDCNPSYDVPSSGACLTNCNIKAGSTYLPGWTMDHTSDKFIASLKIMCVKGTAQYTAFMTTAGMCMGGCSDQELFVNEWAGACTWYNAHKDDVCAPAAITTTTEAPAATTTTTVAAETTTAAADTTTTTTAFVSHTGAPAIVATAISSGVSASGSASGSASVSASGSAAVPPAVSSVPAAAHSDSAATKMQMSGYAMALIACASYFAL